MSRQIGEKKSRRQFLETSAKASALLAFGASQSPLFTPRVHAAGTERRIKIAGIGCGSRGSGAILQALNADPNVVLWAVADVYENKTNGGTEAIRKNLEGNEKGDKFDVPAERRFSGFDAYKKAIDTLEPGDVVILATPPAFRPLHYAYAVEKGVNVFAEKPLAVDIPGLKSLRQSNAKALEKGLKIAVGLNNRHYFRTEETVAKIRDGGLGDITTLYAYRMHPGHSLAGDPSENLMAFQIRNKFNFDWLSGGFVVDALIHNLDICCWAIGGLPVAAQGQGGRLIRKAKDQLIDHGAVEYYFQDGRRMLMFTQTMDNCYKTFKAVIQGTKGSAVVGEGVDTPMIFSDFNADRNRSDAVWTAGSPKNNSYQTEHDRFFKAVRENTPWNELERGIDATFVTILGRMSMETGQFVKAEDAWNSTFQYVRDVAALSLDGPPPVLPDENGDYPLPIPGVTKV